MKNYARLTEELIINISNLLPTCKNASELAKEIHFDVSGVIKHLKKYRSLVETLSINKCGNKLNCSHKQDLCINCFRKGYQSEITCSSCKCNCNQICNDFTKIPNCKRIKRFPYVCNGCPKAQRCRLNKLYYEPNKVWSIIQETRSSSRKGSQKDESYFIRLSNLLVPLVKDKKQSIIQVMLTHKEEIGCSYVTLLRYIDLGLIPNIRNIDLKRVKYPKSYKKKKYEATNTAFLISRTYDDFVIYITEHQGIDVVEMDTVLSSQDGSKCLLTLLFRKSNFMLAFLLNRKTNEEVVNVFRKIRKALGNDLYSKVFQCILTDNGSEFFDPREIEFDMETGVKLCNVFFCDPGKSGQKGKIEKNHVELRKIFTKPTVFDIFTQEQINIALSHVNSEPRGILNGNCPGKIAPIWLNEKVLALNEYKFIEPDSVFLSPGLLK